METEKRGVKVLAVLAVAAITGLVSSPVSAVPIQFTLGTGGVVSYAGGASPLTTTGGTVTSVHNGITSYNVTLGVPGTSGVLNFSTGDFISGSGGGGSFVSTFGEGGSLSLVGSVNDGAVTTLVSGSFLGNSTFSCCSTVFPNAIYSSQFNGFLAISSVDATLASLLGLELPAAGGWVAQVELEVPFAPSNPGQLFAAAQMGGGLGLNDRVQTSSVPEPGTLLLLGSGFVGFGVWRRLTA